MRRLFTFLVLLLATGAAHAQNVCEVIGGASIVADDGTFLGRIENEYSSNSVLNEYGNHGDRYSRTSIWNEYGNYGGEYSKQSPFNPYTNTPPMIIKNGQVIGYLSVNRNLRNTLNPYVLKTCQYY
jgi:hypothetical protein